MEREYNVLPIEYIPTSLAQIAQNLFSPLTLSELRSISYVELVDDIPISLMYTFQDSESEHLLPDLPFSKTLPEDTYFTQTIRVFPCLLYTSCYRSGELCGSYIGEHNYLLRRKLSL